MQEGGRAAITVEHRSRTPFLVAAALTFLADQAAKAAALAALEGEPRVDLLGEFFGLRLVRNTGGVFGIFPDAPLLFFFAGVVILAAVAAWAWRGGEGLIPAGLAVGGGLGNLADRLFRPPSPMRGRVVDFIDFSFWPTFNLGDAAIMVGVALLLLAAARRDRA